MNAEIKEMIASCETCRKFDVSQQKETLQSHELSSRPWEKVAVDLFSYEARDFLITVDYFSNYWELDKLTSTTGAQVIRKLKNHFARHGCPDKVISDNGTQFTSQEFSRFAESWEFKHITSSPYNSKSNGKVESAVKAAKRILRKSLDAGTDPYISILDCRNTPIQGVGASTLQLLMNRRTKTFLLTKNSNKQALYYNKSARDLPPLQVGDCVRMKPLTLGQKTWMKATVVERLGTRSYKKNFGEIDTT